jgi:hypothetical protein
MSRHALPPAAHECHPVSPSEPKWEWA